MPRQKVGRGIYRDSRSGAWEVFVRVAGHPLLHRRLPASASRRDVEDARATWRRELRRTAPTPADPDALSLAARRYLASLVQDSAHAKEHQHHLAEWQAAVHDAPLASLTTALLQSVLASWASQGFAYYTLRHRRAALCALFDHAAIGVNPARATRLPVAKPNPEPRGLPMDVVLRILEALSEQGGVVRAGDHSRPKGARGGRNDVSKTRIRIHVMAHTGMRPSELKRYTPADRLHDGRQLVVRASKDCNNRVIALTPDAEYWLDQLEAEDAVGPFGNGAVQRAFRRALRKVGLAPDKASGAQSVPGTRPGRPRGRTGLIRPYDLRHSFLTAITIASGGTDAAQWIGGHKDPRTTQRYNLNAVSHVQRAAVDKVGALIAQAKVAAKLPAKVTRAATRRT